MFPRKSGERAAVRLWTVSYISYKGSAWVPAFAGTHASDRKIYLSVNLYVFLVIYLVHNIYLDRINTSILQYHLQDQIKSMPSAAEGNVK